jgi:hypothetical protein
MNLSVGEIFHEKIILNSYCTHRDVGYGREWSPELMRRPSLGHSTGPQASPDGREEESFTIIGGIPGGGVDVGTRTGGGWYVSPRTRIRVASAWVLTERHFHRIDGDADFWALAAILGREGSQPLSLLRRNSARCISRVC